MYIFERDIEYEGSSIVGISSDLEFLKKYAQQYAWLQYGVTSLKWEVDEDCETDIFALIPKPEYFDFTLKISLYQEITEKDLKETEEIIDTMIDSWSD